MIPILFAAALLISRSECTFPSYENVPRIDQFATREEYRGAVADKRFVCQKLTYDSSGVPVVAFSYRSADESAPAPLVVFNRGGYVVTGQAPLLVAMFQRFAEAGFAVLAPMYRGSEGAPGHDEIGGADLGDLRNALTLAKEMNLSDGRNVFLYGESRGAVMTFMALRDGFPARAAATFGGFTHLEQYLSGDARARAMAPTIWSDYNDEIRRSRSAIEWADRIRSPLLLMHGGADRQVPPTHTLRLATKLQGLGREYGLIIFAGDNHALGKRRLDRDREAIRWFRDHLAKD